jgi:hypothetical protein
MGAVQPDAAPTAPVTPATSPIRARDSAANQPVKNAVTVTGTAGGVGSINSFNHNGLTWPLSSFAARNLFVSGISEDRDFNTLKIGNL